MGDSLTTYIALVEQARANNRQGFPVGAAYQREASALVRDEVLPQIDQLTVDTATRTSDSVSDGVASQVALWLTAIAVLAAIVIGSVWLYRPHPPGPQRRSGRRRRARRARHRLRIGVARTRDQHQPGRARRLVLHRDRARARPDRRIRRQDEREPHPHRPGQRSGVRTALVASRPTSRRLPSNARRIWAARPRVDAIDRLEAHRSVTRHSATRRRRPVRRSGETGVVPVDGGNPRARPAKRLRRLRRERPHRARRGIGRHQQPARRCRELPRTAPDGSCWSAGWWRPAQCSSATADASGSTDDRPTPPRLVRRPRRRRAGRRRRSAAPATRRASPTTTAPAATSTAPAAPTGSDDCHGLAPTASYAPLDPMPAPGQMPAGSTMAEIAAKGRLIVGNAGDVALFGYPQPDNGTARGLRHRRAQEIAKAIFGPGGERPDRLQGHQLRPAPPLARGSLGRPRGPHDDDQLHPLEPDRLLDRRTSTPASRCWSEPAPTATTIERARRRLGARMCVPQGSTNIESIAPYTSLEVTQVSRHHRLPGRVPGGPGRRDHR